MRANQPAYNVVIITLDAHATTSIAHVENNLQSVIPGLIIKAHAAAEWSENPAALKDAIADVAQGDIIIVNLLFLEEHVQAILPALRARRDECDAMEYWLGSSEDNIEAMVRFLISRYGSDDALRTIEAPEPIEYAEVGLYHPSLS